MMVTCPYCQTELDSPVELQVGQHIQCSICGKTFPYGFARGVRLEDKPSRVELPKGRKVEQSPSRTANTAARRNPFSAKKHLSSARSDVESNRKIWVLVLCSLVLSVTIVSNCSIEKPKPVPRHYTPKEKVEVRQRIEDEEVRGDEPIVEERSFEESRKESLVKSQDDVGSVADDLQSIKAKVSTVLYHKGIEPLNWQRSWDRVEELRKSSKSAEAEQIINAGNRAISCMAKAQEVLIEKTKGYTFRKNRLKGRRIVSADTDSMRVVNENGDVDNVLPWLSIIANYQGNLNELFNVFIVRGRETAHLDDSEWESAMLGAALMMRTYCSANPSAMAYGEKLARQVEEENPQKQELVQMMLELTSSGECENAVPQTVRNAAVVQKQEESEPSSRRELLDSSNGRIVGMLGQCFGAAKRSGGVEQTQVWPNGKVCHSNFYVWELTQNLHCFSEIGLGYTPKSNRLYAIQLIAKLNTSRSRSEVNEIVEKVKDWLQEEAGVRFSSCRKDWYGYLIYCDETGRNGDADVNISLATSSSGDPRDPPDKLIFDVVQTDMMMEGFRELERGTR